MRILMHRQEAGFTYIGSADLGYASYGLDNFKLYERRL